MYNNWILLAAISAIFFGLGDFIVVYSENRGLNVVTLYITYTILIGLLNLLYLILFRNYDVKTIISFTTKQWFIVFGLCLFYFFAYLLHFVAIQKATNPGYANSLVMFHVILLTVLSYYFLAKPLNSKALFGIFLMFIGGYYVTMYSGV